MDQGLGIHAGTVALTPALVLFVAALLAGALNSVAGGGSFISFPALLLVGVPAINANTTSSTALLVGTGASAGAYRRDFNLPVKTLAVLSLASAAGGGLGAAVLLRTPERTFESLVPYLLAFATAVFAGSARIVNWFHRSIADVSDPSARNLAVVSLIQLTIAFYGGYFGGGIGIMILAVLALMGMQQINTMNAVKTLMGGIINGIAVLAFIAARTIWWPQAVIMMGGAVLGGYFGAHYARRTDPRAVRSGIIAAGALMSAYLFVRRWL